MNHTRNRTFFIRVQMSLQVKMSVFLYSLMDKSALLASRHLLPERVAQIKRTLVSFKDQAIVHIDVNNLTPTGKKIISNKDLYLPPYLSHGLLPADVDKLSKEERLELRDKLPDNPLYLTREQVKKQTGMVLNVLSGNHSSKAMLEKFEEKAVPGSALFRLTEVYLSSDVDLETALNKSLAMNIIMKRSASQGEDFYSRLVLGRNKYEFFGMPKPNKSKKKDDPWVQFVEHMNTILKTDKYGSLSTFWTERTIILSGSGILLVLHTSQHFIAISLFVPLLMKENVRIRAFFITTDSFP